jgi:YjbR
LRFPPGTACNDRVTDYGEVPAEVVDRLRAICAALPEAYEEQAWVGTRWRIRKRTIAHVVAVSREHPPAYVTASGIDGPAVVLTFQSTGPELDALTRAGYPFFKPVWSPTIVGIVLDEATDWGEVAELLTESYCVLAPKKLVAQVDRPGG